MTHSQPPQGPRDPDDLMFGEAELRALYGKLPKNEPSPSLDAAVLRAATEAILTPPHVPSVQTRTVSKRTGKPPPRWLIGLGSAATLVLAVGLAWRMRSVPPPDQPSRVTQEVSAVAPANSSADASRAAASTAMLATVATPPPPPMPAMPAPAQRALQAARPQASAKAVADRTITESAREQVAADSPSAAPVEASAAWGKAKPQREAPAPEQRSSANSAAAAPPPNLPVPPIRPAIPEAGLTQSLPPPAPAAPSAPAAAVAATPNAQADPAQTQDTNRTPTAELEEIRKLFAEGKSDDAQRRLEAFHRLRPRWQLAPDLQARLRKP